jgi:DNA repair exonuclease SbcCD ATPase subunit
MMMRKDVLVLVTGFSLCFLGCERESKGPQGPETAKAKPTAEDVKRETRQAAETAAAYSKEQAQQLRREVEDRLAKLDKRIETLKQQGDELSGNARQKWEAQMKRVSEKRQALESKLEALQNTSADAWADARRGVGAAWEDLEKAYKKAAGEFQGSEDNEETSGQS